MAVFITFCVLNDFELGWIVFTFFLFQALEFYFVIRINSMLILGFWVWCIGFVRNDSVWVTISYVCLFRPNPMSGGQESDQAPPRRLANALEGLGRAVRHIADVRSGADLLLEALDAGAMLRGQETGGRKASDGIQKAADAMRKALDELRATGNILIVH